MTQKKFDWLDVVPDNWKRMRLKDVGYLYGGLTGKSGDDFKGEATSDTKPFIPFTNILNNVYIDPNQIKYVVISDGEKQNAVKQGDLLFLMSSEDYEGIGKAAVVNCDMGEVYLNSFCKGFRVTDKSVFAPFLCYQLLGYDCHNTISIEAQGFTRINIQTGKIAGTKIAIPSFEEQVRIVQYLDGKLGNIDTYIAQRNWELKQLKIFKQAKINEVVVRGINNEVQTKDCGLKWLGKIPVHWAVRRIKDVFVESDEVSTTGKEDLLSVSEYYGVALRKDRMSDDEEFETRADSLEGYKICHTGDLVSNIMLTWKRALGISDYEGIVSPAYAVYRGINIFPKYYHYLFRSDMYIAEFKRNSTGIIESRLRLYSDRFFAIKTIYPPLDEQKEIAEYLDKECRLVDEKCALIEKQIEELQLLKSALINEVVTGKRVIA